jgi:outer membrane protein OmpA-like peptidoglycan-associated protein
MVGADVSLLGSVAWAQGGLDPVRDGTLGAGGAVVRVERVLRRADGLEVTLSVTHRGSGYLSGTAFRSYLRPQGSIGVAAVDPVTGRLGQLRSNGTTCQCGTLPVLGPGKAATVVTVLDDPGGAVVDLVFDTFQPVTGVAVEGTGTPSAGAVTTLAARSFTPLARTKDAGASVAGADRVDLDTDVLFAFGSATLTSKASQAIVVAARALKAQPKRRLAVFGHTDGIGAPQSNLTLSRQRAEAVHAALATALGQGWTFDVQGFGETRPVAPEKTAEGADYPLPAGPATDGWNSGWTDLGTQGMSAGCRRPRVASTPMPRQCDTDLSEFATADRNLSPNTYENRATATLPQTGTILATPCPRSGVKAPTVLPPPVTGIWCVAPDRWLGGARALTELPPTGYSGGWLGWACWRSPVSSCLTTS